MTFQNLDNFIVTATEQSFTKAAGKLYITQQSLSGQIAALERELGCQLFVRTKPLQLTKAGKLLYNYAVEIMREYRNLKGEMILLAEQAPDEITIGISFAGALHRFRDILPEFRLIKPSVRIKILEMSGGDLIDRLREGTVDFAITHFPEHDPAFERYPLYDEEIVLAVTDDLLENCFGRSKKRVIRGFEEKSDYTLLRSCPYIHSRRNNIVSRFADRFMAEHNPTPIVTAESDSLETLIELCLNNVGFSFLPRSITADMVKDEPMERLHFFSLGETAFFPIHYGYLKNSPKSETLMRFLQITSRHRQNQGCGERDL